MCSDLLKVGLVTVHIPVSAVSASISKEGILSKLRALRHALIQDFSVREPRIAVLSLNPHAGDGGLIGQEEEQIIAPAIQAAFAEKILAFGPFPADGFFAAARGSEIRRRTGHVSRSGTRPVQGTGGRRRQLHGRPARREDQPGARRRIRHRRERHSQRKRHARGDLHGDRRAAQPQDIPDMHQRQPALRKYKRETGADVSASELPSSPKANSKQRYSSYCTAIILKFRNYD